MTLEPFTPPLPFIDLAAQQSRLRPELEAAMHKVMDHGRYIMGPEITELEARLSAFCDVKEVISCSSGTDALILPLMAMGIGPGDGVLCPSFTFTATAEAIALVGATPIFVDVQATTFNMDPASLKRAISAEKARGALSLAAIISVDMFGLPVEYTEITQIARDNTLRVISDAAQSFGGRYQGKTVGNGTLCDVTTTSFFPSKPLGCYGDGGAVLTNDSELAEVMRSIRVHGQGADKYDNIRLGLNARMDSLQAAVLLEKLTIFEDELDRRDAIAAAYTAHLHSHKVTCPPASNDRRSAWAQYTITTDNRDGLSAHLKQYNVPTMVYYPKPIHTQAPYATYPQDPMGLPVTEKLSQHVLSLPMHPYLDQAHIERISKIVGIFDERAAAS